MTAEKKACAQSLVERGIDIASACKLADLSRASYYRRERDLRKQDTAVIDAINDELKRSPQAGLWKCYGRIRHKGYPFNHKRVYRVYCQMGLNLKCRVKRILPKRICSTVGCCCASQSPMGIRFYAR